MGDREKEVKDLKEALKALLFALGKITNETSLKKMYREQYGESLNQKLLKIGIESTVYNFLRYQCRDICEIYRMDNENKIQRISTEYSSHMEHFHKSRKRNKKGNQAPKLNVPKVGILQNTTFRRLNPQGFNKNKMVNNNRNLINAYRHPIHVNLEDKENTLNELENEYAPNSKITLEDFVPLEEIIKDGNQAATQQSSSKADVLKEAPSPKLSVQNSNQFPSLPEKKEPIGGLFDDPEEDEQKEDVRSGSEQSALMRNWNKVAAALKTPIRKVSASQRPPKVAQKVKESAQQQTPITKPAAHNQNFSQPPPGYQNFSAIISKTPPALFSKPPPGYQQATTSSSKSNANYYEFPPEIECASSMSSLSSSLASLWNLDQVLDNNVQKKLPFNNISIDDPIFLVGYKGVILNPNLKLTKPHPKIFVTKVSFPVHVAIINDPSDVTFHFDDASLRRLFNDMQTYYEELPVTALMINDINFRAGLLVACNIFGFWHRASISGDLYENGCVEVTFEDFGYSLEVHRDRLRHLISTFAELPRLCFRASLVGVEALDETQGWSYETLDKLKKLTYGKLLFASLRSYDASDDIFLLDLMESPTSSKTISNELIEANVAKAAYVDETLPFGYIFPYSEY